MKQILLITTMIILSAAAAIAQDSSAVYSVKKLQTSIKIDANWNKPEWKDIIPVQITHYMGDIPAFRPTVQAKMMYDDANLYVIFHIADNYVNSIVEEYNGPVSTDACVEFFFSPLSSIPEGYFNLEVNAGGTPLMAYQVHGKKEHTPFTPEDFRQIEIAHSLPKKIEKEITTPVTWTIEYRLPVSLLEKFSGIEHPAPGIIWKANFYKISSKGSNPHYITWSPVDNPVPNFHLPAFFGQLKFIE